MKQLTRIQIKKITGCPRCGAMAGNECFQKDGKTRRKANHNERLLKAQEIAGHSVKRGKKKAKKKRPAQKDTKADAFYASWEWKQARYEALQLHGRQCMCCGWSPAPGAKGHLCVDHIKPRSKFPALELDVSNLQVLCNSCNMGKSNIHQDDFRTEWHGEEESDDDIDPLTAQFNATMQ